MTNALPFGAREEVQKFMRDKHENDQLRISKKQIAKLSLVVLRADKDCTFKQVHDVMTACRRAGYSDIQLRAIKVDPNQYK